MKEDLALFEGHEIRRVYDEKSETWFFSVIDIVRVLTQRRDYQAARKYWKVLKGRMAKEGSQLVTDCYQLKMAAEDGRHGTRRALHPSDCRNSGGNRHA